MLGNILCYFNILWSLSVFSKKVKGVESFHISANLFNVWLRRWLDSPICYFTQYHTFAHTDPSARSTLPTTLHLPKLCPSFKVWLRFHFNQKAFSRNPKMRCVQQRKWEDCIEEHDLFQVHVGKMTYFLSLPRTHLNDGVLGSLKRFSASSTWGPEFLPRRQPQCFWIREKPAPFLALSRVSATSGS